MSITLTRVGQSDNTAPPVKPSTPLNAPATSKASPQDSVTLTEATATATAPDLTYTDPRNKVEAEAPDLEKLLAESDRKVEEFMAYLRPLLEQQGLAIDKVVKGEQKLTVDAATIEKAKADIAEDGEFGVRNTAERILNFAKLGIGSDPAKIETFRAAIQKGFDEAQAMLGGVLPEISQQTHQAIMDELDRWVANGIPEGSVSLAKAEPAQSDTART
jgi:hypothetical protein